MCLLAIFHRVVEDAPLIIGANREEAYARGGEPPQVLEGPLRAVGGLDPTSGGTWLAVNQRGVLIAVTNRAKHDVPPEPRSRGLLVRDLLACTSAAAAAGQAVQLLTSHVYAGCNLLCADAERALIIQAGSWIRVRPLPPGLHVITNRDINDLADRRSAHALVTLSRRTYRSSDECVRALQKLCGQTGGEGPAICLKGDQGGTVSSSIVVVKQPVTAGQYLHAQGPPDRTPYQDCTPLLKALGTGR